MRPAQKGGKYITQRRLHGFCDLSLEWTYILPITVKLVLFQVDMFLQSGYLIGSRSKFSNHWMTGNWSFSENLTNWESLHSPNYHMSMRNRKVISKWFINLISSVRWCLTLVSEYGAIDVDTKLRSTADHGSQITKWLAVGNLPKI